MRLLLVAVVIPLGLLAVLGWIWFGRRPTADQFASAHGLTLDDATLPSVRVALRRTYLGRVLGALVGGALLAGLGLLIGVGAAVGAGFIGLVAGAMVGIALAQHQPRAAPGPIRRATLHARTIADYAPKHAARSVVATAVAVVAITVAVPVAAPAGLGSFAAVVALAAATLLVIPLGWWLQHRIVSAPRDTTEITLDDALRSAAVRAVHHSVLGVLLCGIVVASLGGVLTQSVMTVETPAGTVFSAPPGSTSLSIDTGLRSNPGLPDGPVRIYWIEADGSEHHTGPLAIEGTPTYGSRKLPRFGQLFGWLMLGATIAVLVQLSRATNAWRRHGRAAGPAPPAGARIAEPTT